MRREFELRTFRSSVDAVFLEHLVDDGDSVRDTPVGRLDALRVKAVLPGRLIGTLARERDARVYPEFGDDPPPVTGFDVIDSMLGAQSGTFGVQLTLANADLAIGGDLASRIVFEKTPAIAAAVGAVGAGGDVAGMGKSDDGLDVAPASKAQTVP